MHPDLDAPLTSKFGESTITVRSFPLTFGEIERRV